MPKWQGKKSGGSHTTLIEAAVPLIREAEKLAEVTKIALGFIKSTPGQRGTERVKFKRSMSGLLMTVRGHTSVQAIRIYTVFPDIVQQSLEKVRM